MSLVHTIAENDIGDATSRSNWSRPVCLALCRVTGIKCEEATWYPISHQNAFYFLAIGSDHVRQ